MTWCKVERSIGQLNRDRQTLLKAWGTLRNVIHSFLNDLILVVDQRSYNG